MNRPSYDKLMISQAESAKGKKLLLHCCCAPCSSACLERLKDYFQITVLFYNPNIEDEEYERRKAELKRFVAETGFANFLDCDHEKEKYYSRVKGLEKEKEGGKRCEECFALRLEKTAELAKDFDFFTTTLTISPLKDARMINVIGERLGGEKWLYSDFKKRNGYLRSIELSSEHSLYRQNYCGCVYSRRDGDKD